MMKRFIAVVIAVLAISLLVSCGNLSLAGKNASLPNKNGEGTISIRLLQETPNNASRAVTIPTQNDVTKYQIAIYTTSDHTVVSSDMDITPEKMAEGIKKELAYGTYAVSVNALRGDEIIFRGVSGSVEITKDNTEDNPAQAEVDMKQILAVYDNGTESENHLWEKYIGEADATHLSWILPSIDDVTDDSWKIDGKEVIGWKITETGFEYDAGDKIWLSGKTLPLHLEAIWAEPDTAEPIVKLIEFFTHDGSILSAEQENFAITSEELAEDGTFELPIEELTAYLQGWGSENLPEGSTCVGWKDAAGKLWTLSETMSVEDLPDELPLKLYAQWDLPARVSYCFNNNWPDPEDIVEMEDTGYEGETITLDELLDNYSYNITEILEYYGYMFIGCSVNEPFPLIDSSNYDEIMEELNNTDFLEEGDSYELTADDTVFYAIWADFDSLSDAGKALTVNYCLGEYTNNEYANKAFYYLKDDMTSFYDESTGSAYYELPLPNVDEIIPEWNNTPSGTIKENMWKLGQESKAPGDKLKISEYESTVNLWSEIKVPVIQYWNGGSEYGVVDGNADSIMSNPDMEKWVYEKTWPFSGPWWRFKFWGSTESPTQDAALSALASFAPVPSLEFAGWYDEETETLLEPENERINLAGRKNFPIKLVARWEIPEHQGSFPDTGYDATDFTQTKFYQISDVQWNSPLESSEPLGLTVTGGKDIDYTCTGTEFLKLKNIQGGSSITADIYLYTSEDDTEGTLKGTYTIDAVTKYGIKTGTPFLFTGQGLNHYNSLTADEASPYRMNSEKIICNPTNIGAVQTAINESLGGLVSLSSADDVLALMNDTSDEKYTKRYAVLQDITVTELSKSLFEKQFNGYFDGQNHTITVSTGKAPLFKDIGASGEVCNISLAGDFSTYTEPYRDFGVICSNNYGKLHDCSFTGTAPSSTSESVGTTGVFGYQAPGSTSGNNSITSGTDPSDARLYSTMYQITMIPITGAEVSTSIGSGAFASASTESVTVGDFLIAEAEVTYKQWREVYDWATSNGYTFSSNTLTGRPGDTGTDGAELTTANATIPVTEISYSDILVWCNAASETQGLAPVYYVKGTTGEGFQNSSNVLRNATTPLSIAATSNPAADGYRLPEQKEWEYAARGGNPDDETAWNYTYAGTDDPQGYAVQYNLTDANGTKYSQIVSVKTLIPNTAGLYDMSGNAAEFFFLEGNSTNSSRYLSSSENSSKNNLKVDYSYTSTSADIRGGFRVVRGAQSGGNTFISMVNVPGGTVKTAIGNGAFSSDAIDNATDNEIKVNAFKIGQTEVTYAQWCEVYDWAENNGYSFAQTGQPGNNGEGQSLTDANGSQPATNMSWRDVIVWCNAASEYKNLEPVYYEKGTGVFSSSNVIREAETSSVKSAGQGKADNITVNPDANGYRLPTEAEWEYAARGGNPDAAAWNYTYPGSNTCEVANRTTYTTTVGSLTGNSLGLFDMCGNAGEFVWKKKSSYPDYRYYRGGTCHSSESNCTITSYSCVDDQTLRNTDLGFRVVTGGAGNFGNL